MARPEQKAATLRTTEVAALEAEVSRLRAALENLRDGLGVLAVSALTAKPATTAAGVAYHGRLASDALEEA